MNIQIKKPTQLKNLLVRYVNTDKQIVILCIGSDRSIGDSLGPLVGHFLKSSGKKVIVEGSLKNTLTALNLNDIIKKYKNGNNFIITIDASVSSKRENIGKIFFRDKALKPGIGVGKEYFQEVGDLTIQGVVNEASGFVFEKLQYTKLSIVMEMAENIAKGINLYISHIEKGGELTVKQKL